MTANLMLPVITILFSFIFLLLSLNLPHSVNATYKIGPTFWPSLLMMLMLIMGIIQLVKVLKLGVGTEKKVEKQEVNNNTGVLVVIVVFFYLLAIPYLGFFISTVTIMLIMARILGFKNPIRLTIFSLLGTMAISYVFIILLSIPLPRGIGFIREITYLFY